MCAFFSQYIPFQFPPVNLDMYPLSIYVTEILGLGDKSVKPIKSSL